MTIFGNYYANLLIHDNPHWANPRCVFTTYRFDHPIAFFRLVPAHMIVSAPTAFPFTVPCSDHTYEVTLLCTSRPQRIVLSVAICESNSKFRRFLIYTITVSNRPHHIEFTLAFPNVHHERPAAPLPESTC
jgi:hypothetical protein